ncbi:MAG: LamG-like jellyroll fold domain-containing protein [Planctomycetota bacterium]
MSDSEFRELNELLGDLRDNSLSQSGRGRLEEVLKESEEARQYYVEYIELCATLALFGAASDREVRPQERRAIGDRETPVDSVDGPRPVTHVSLSERGRRRGLAIAAVAAIALLGVFLIYPWPERRFPTVYGDGGVAVVSRVVNARWARDDAPAVGRRLRAERFSLVEGFARVDLYGGTHVTFEGPVDFQVRSTEGVAIEHGRARVSAPSTGRPFVVSTPGGTIRSTGSEFALEVSDVGVTSVHVLGGQVECTPHSKGVQATVLKEGEAISIDLKLNFARVPCRVDEFVDSEELEKRWEDSSRARQEVWRAHREQLLTRSDVLAYFTFDNQPISRRARDLSARSAGDSNGVVIGCRPIEGRSPHSRAIEFKRASDRVKIDRPGLHRSLTLVAWVWLDALDREFNSLMLSDRDEDGMVHWQITQNGHVELAVGEDYTTHRVVRSRDIGRWLHLAVVYDGERRKVIHYVDGTAVTTHSIEERIDVEIGDAEIGNWAVPAEGDTRELRALNGRIDEFAAFSSPMSADEIRRHFELTAP